MKALRKAKRELFKAKLYEKKLQMIKDKTYSAPAKIFNKKGNNAENNARPAPSNEKQQTNSVEKESNLFSRGNYPEERGLFSLFFGDSPENNDNWGDWRCSLSQIR